MNKLFGNNHTFESYRVLAVLVGPWNDALSAALTVDSVLDVVTAPYHRPFRMKPVHQILPPLLSPSFARICVDLAVLQAWKTFPRRHKQGRVVLRDSCIKIKRSIWMVCTDKCEYCKLVPCISLCKEEYFIYGVFLLVLHTSVRLLFISVNRITYIIVSIVRNKLRIDSIYLWRMSCYWRLFELYTGSLLHNRRWPFEATPQKHQRNSLQTPQSIDPPP